MLEGNKSNLTYSYIFYSALNWCVSLHEVSAQLSYPNTTKIFKFYM